VHLFVKRDAWPHTATKSNHMLDFESERCLAIYKKTLERCKKRVLGAFMVHILVIFEASVMSLLSAILCCCFSLL
jgi:hypothetical protein